MLEKKLNALTRLCKFLSLNKRRVLMKVFIMSQLASPPPPPPSFGCFVIGI